MDRPIQGRIQRFTWVYVSERVEHERRYGGRTLSGVQRRALGLAWVRVSLKQKDFLGLERPAKPQNLPSFVFLAKCSLILRMCYGLCVMR